jgi:hypothetical protein
MREFVFDRYRQDYAVEALTRIRGRQKLSEITPRSCDRRQLRRCGCRGPMSGMRPLAQLFGQPRVTFLLFSRRKLHGEIEEAIDIAFRVTLDETDELLR